MEDAVETLLSLTSNASAIDMAKKAKLATAERAIPKMKKYLLRTGITQEDLNRLSVIHVSGTKGKGSTCAFSERILSCHGYTTGLFTSPHLLEVRERIRINGRPISKELFSEHFWDLYTKLKETEIPSRAGEGYDMPFFFNFLTVMSVHVFLKEEVDVAIMEVGIGGQYDSTNLFERPVVCGVTALGLDHTNILGSSIEEIAWNKAGIFKVGQSLGKRDRPAIVVPQDPKAMQVILDRAREIQSPLFVSENLSMRELNRLNIRLGIDCDQQAQNACLAVQLTDFWMEFRKTGLSTCVWHGRTQTIKRERTTYYVDGAHTKESLEACTKWFKQKADEEKRSHGGSVVRILIFNTTGDRDVELFLSLLKPCNFDVALFCTNQLSTVESLTKSGTLRNRLSKEVDQYHNLSTWKKMMDKAMTNKRLWDQVSLASTSPSCSSTSSVDPITNTTITDPELGRDLPGGVISESSADGPATITDPKLGQYISGEVISKSVSDSTTSAITNPKLCPANSVEVSPGESSHPDTVTDTSIRASGAEHIPSSLAFPCILHALAWATQGRDPKIRVKDHRGVGLPEAPARLREAGHVQILITGSLHLVGGALEALTPDMNQ
ncbi:hypothetical protein EGW08_008815 [Elysia chlorotica]|uniref:Folylpolyglutamate synthase n=1 Tax=Elysia chlorotica TaxID=188477 RepID=A0A433TP91_ELYCH|nr:hypothetical protein EGW08_008815 [Elysia chlorotica]